LGAYYGARLQAGGCEVHFLVNSDYDHVKRHGLKIKSKDGDFDLPQVPLRLPSPMALYFVCAILNLHS
jgi:ketopantoate reductase